MAWIYLAESVESHLPYPRGSEQGPIVKTTDTLKLCCCREYMMDDYHELQSGTTLHRLAGPCYQVSTSSTEDSHARTLALRELEEAWMGSDLDSFQKYCDSLANYDRGSSSWKTSQQSLFGGLTEFSWESLRWGMIVDGRLFQPQNLVPSTLENDGSYLPTPTASDYGRNTGRKSDGTPSGRDRWSLTVRARCGELPNHPKGSLNPEWIEQAMGFPVGWTAIEDWVMQWFRPKREKRLKD